MIAMSQGRHKFVILSASELSCVVQRMRICDESQPIKLTTMDWAMSRLFAIAFLVQLN